MVLGITVTGVVLNTQHHPNVEWWWHLAVGIGVLAVGRAGVFLSVLLCGLMTPRKPFQWWDDLAGAAGSASGAALTFSLIIGRGEAIWLATLIGFGVALILGSVLNRLLDHRLAKP